MGVVQEELGGAGVYSMDDRELWAAVAECERRDVLPEVWSGHNIADFVDADVDERLAALEAEEDAAAAAWEAQVMVFCTTPLSFRKERTIRRKRIGSPKHGG